MAPHRFWRIFCRTNGYGSYPCLAEVAMASAPGGANLIGAGTALAGSFYSAATAPAAATDSDASTWWNAAGALPDWWGYDFTAAGACDVVEVKLTARGDSAAGASTAPSAWDLQSSDDGTSWTTEHSFTAAAWTLGGQQAFSDAALTPIGTGRVAGAIAAVAGSRLAPAAAAAGAGLAAMGCHANPATGAAGAGAAVMGFHGASNVQVDGVWLSVMVRASLPTKGAAPQFLIMV